MADALLMAVAVIVVGLVIAGCLDGWAISRASQPARPMTGIRD